MSNTVIITRKYNLIPEKCDQKIWKKKVREFLENEIIRMNELISQRSNKQAWKEKLKAKTEQYEAYLKKYDETDVFPVKAYTDYTYSLIRTAMEDEARRKNYIMTHYRRTLVTLVVSKAVLYFILLIVIFLLLLMYV